MCSFENATAAKRVRMAATAKLDTVRSEVLNVPTLATLSALVSAVLNSVAIFDISTIVTET